MRVKYSCPILMLGDANAHTKKLNDLNNIEPNQLPAEFALDLFEDVSEAMHVHCSRPRSNYDRIAVNWNGRALIDMCKANNMLLLNGRAGQDAGVGNYTCFSFNENSNLHEGVSTIDYCIASQSIWPWVKDFEIDTFDRMLSDRHAPVILTLEVPISGSKPDPPQTANNADPPSGTPPPIFNTWNPSIANKMSEKFSQI